MSYNDIVIMTGIPQLSLPVRVPPPCCLYPRMNEKRELAEIRVKTMYNLVETIDVVSANLQVHNSRSFAVALTLRYV